jgi:hypothetical protein
MRAAVERVVMPGGAASLAVPRYDACCPGVEQKDASYPRSEPATLPNRDHLTRVAVTEFQQHPLGAGRDQRNMRPDQEGARSHRRRGNIGRFNPSGLEGEKDLFQVNAFF